MKNGKTVYILGAGASKLLGLPLQHELLDKIFSFEINSQTNSYELDSFFYKESFNLAKEEIADYYRYFNKARIKLADFIISSFAIDSKKAEYNILMSEQNLEDGRNNERKILSIAKEIAISLEDLFTIFDKTIIEETYFRNYSYQEIKIFHNCLQRAIIFILAQYSFSALKDLTLNSQMEQFANFLYEKREKAELDEDKVAILSMNWDAVLEKIIYKVCNQKKIDNSIKVLPDLCFYDNPLNEASSRIVSTHVKAKKIKNIKILKLHGSINWLICPICERVFVEYNDGEEISYDIGLKAFHKKEFCRFCFPSSYDTEVLSKEVHMPPIIESLNHTAEGIRANLRSLIITPTFLKDLNNLHIKNIWHNAFLNLVKASKVVFIGYSLPEADFEMRYLLKKAINPNTEIEVVLAKSDKPETYEEKLSNCNNKTEIIEKLKLPETRYKTFFSGNKLKFCYNGIEGYLKELTQKESQNVI